jgi:DNA-binding PadR family transcriptional regulator
MTTLSPTAYVILGMLRLGRRTGYEIKQLVDNSTRFFWAASYGQIYPELKKLEESGLVISEPDPQGGRQRRAYALTTAGDQALDSWLRDSDETGFEMRDLGLLKLFFADGLAPDEAAALARSARRRHEAVVAALEQVERGKTEDTPAPRMPFEVLRFGLDFHRWCVQRYTQMEQELQGAKEAV